MTAFRWQDGERLIVFGPGVFESAVPELLDTQFTLLTTPRFELGGAARRLDVGPGRVDELAAELLPQVETELLVALGGGRVIDVAKALAAAAGDRRETALPHR